MSTALVVSLGIRWFTPFHGSEPAVFAKQTLVTAALTTMAWICVTLLTAPEPAETLEKFYRRVRPDAFGWKPVARLAADVEPQRNLGRNLLDWIVGSAMIYFALFGVGKISLLNWKVGISLIFMSVGCAIFLYSGFSRFRTVTDEISAAPLAVPSKT